MKTLIFCIALSLIIHIALLINYGIKHHNDNIALLSAASYINVEIMQASQGKINAEDKSGSDELSQMQSNDNIEKKIEKSIAGKKEDIKKQQKKSTLKTAKKGFEGYEQKEAYTVGYASYVPEPIYPLTSRRNKEEGSITFNINIDEKGSLITYKIIQSSGYKRLDKEAEKSIKNAKFQPAIKNGIPITSNFNLKITFTLKGHENI